MTQSRRMTQRDESDAELLARADELIEFYGADPQGIGTAKPCACAQGAIDRGYLILHPDCKVNACKELRQ